MKRKYKLGFMFVAIILALMSACSSVSDSGADNKPSATGDGAVQSEEASLRIGWWGNPVRHERTEAVIELFEKENAGIELNAEYSGGSAQYFDKLKTQIAGGNAPDIMQQGGDLSYYIDNNVLLDLTPYIGKELDLSQFDELSLELGKHEDKFYGVNMGNNGIALYYNMDLLKQANLELPTAMTWDEYAQFGEKIVQALGSDYVAFTDQSHYADYFQYYLRQNGKSLLKDGALNFTEEDVAAWFAMWNDFRGRGLIPSAEVAAAHNEQEIESSVMIKGKAVFTMKYLNVFPATQNAMQDEIGLTSLPAGGAGSSNGDWIQAGVFMTVNAKSESPTAAVKFVNYMINNPGAAEILAAERGFPVSAEIREGLMATLSPAEVKMFQHYDNVTTKASRRDATMPPNGPFGNTFVTAAHKVAFGNATPEEAAKEVMEAANQTVNAN